MKKNICIVIILVFFLTGCQFKSDTPDVSELTTCPAETLLDDHLIREVIKEGSFSANNSGEPLNYHFALPQIQADTPAAVSINKTILSVVPQEGMDPEYEKISWESHWNNSLLSLILKLRRPFANETEYAVFNYDFKAEKALSNKELAIYAGITEAELKDRLIRCTAVLFDKTYRDQGPDFLQSLWDLRAQTISSENIPFGEIPIFLDDTNTPAAIIPMAAPAGAGYVPTAVRLTAPSKISLNSSDGYASAEVKDGKAYITFLQTSSSRWSQDPELVPHNKPIPVDRLYGNYVDVIVGNLSFEFWPVAIFLDENGLISFCNLMDYDENTGSFHGIGPIPCASPISSLSETDGAWGIRIPCGMDRSQETVDVYQPIYDASSSLSSYLYDAAFTSLDRVYTARLSAEDSIYNLTWGEDGNHLATGYAFPLGMDPNGLHYFYDLSQEGGDVSGSFTLHFPAISSGDYPYVTMYNTSLNSMPGLPSMGQIQLFWEAP